MHKQFLFSTRVSGVKFRDAFSFTYPMSLRSLKKFLDNHPDMAGFVINESSSMFLFSDENGNILWANAAFLDWIGYSLVEFTREHNPVTWIDLTAKDSSLDADLELTEATKRGDILEYKIRKFYIPKNGTPQFVELFVRRYPPSSADKLVHFIVEVFPLNGKTGLVQEYEKLNQQLVSELREIATTQKELANTQSQLIDTNKGLSDNLAKLSDSTVAALFRQGVLWLSQHPTVAVPLVLLLLYVIFGERVLEIYKLLHPNH